MLKFFLSIILLVTCFCEISAQYFQNYEKVYRNFSDSISWQKIYLHTDKNNYSSNETIWHKAYLFDSKNNYLDSTKQIIYIELISPEEKIVYAKQYLCGNGTTYGKIFIPDSLLSGKYQLRAFTENMKNFSSLFYFCKTISIETKNKLYKNEYRIKDKSQKKKQNQIFCDMSYSSQNLVAGIDNKIIFNCFDYMGNQLDCNARIISNKRKHLYELYPINDNFVELKPIENEKLKIVFTSNNYKKRRIKLNKAENSGISINTNQQKESLTINFISNYPKTKDTLSRTYYIIVEKNGKIYSKKEAEVFEKEQLSIDNKELPKGISRLVIFNKNYEKIFEQQIYIEPKKPDFIVETSRINDTLNVHIKITKSNFANISISLTKDTSKNTNIFDYYYFFSGIISTSLNRFINTNTEQKQNLIITETKFKYSADYEDLLNTNYKKHKEKTGVTISGRVSNILEKVPAKNASLSLTILNSYNDVFYTTTDENGFFKFENLIYPDSIEFLIEAQTQQGKKHVVIFLDNYDTSDIYFNENQNEIKKFKLKKSQEKKVKKRTTIHSNADQIIYFDEINTASTSNPLEVLQGRVPGYDTQGESSLLRGFTSITQSNEPLYLIDDIPTNASAVSNLNIDDIDRIEIIKNASYSAIYGQRGSNGIIAVYTKQGYNIIWGKIYSKTAGISQKIFFEKDTTKSLNKTVFWNPEIKINTKDTIIKIPLNKIDSNFVLNIQGVDNYGFPLFSTNYIK
ncbi:MAG: TonB-dependent receptor plug domain-containing protein [Bacteroidales bacterium]|nr:TonB-dependent receptor plug domain-containing protein [Bacteroidales bacterium]